MDKEITDKGYFLLLFLSFYKVDLYVLKSDYF